MFESLCSTTENLQMWEHFLKPGVNQEPIPNSNHAKLWEINRTSLIANTWSCQIIVGTLAFLIMIKRRSLSEQVAKNVPTRTVFHVNVMPHNHFPYITLYLCLGSPSSIKVSYGQNIFSH